MLMLQEPPPQPVLFDVTRLAARLVEDKHPTGIDRVSLAYLAHFQAGARAMVRHLGRWVMFGPRASARIFAALLDPAPHQAMRIRREMVAGHLLSRRLAHGSILFNTGHSGLDEPDYAARIARFGLRPVYFVHDLIPISHPEYCRDGESERHKRRMLTILKTGHGMIANSADTAAAIAGFAERRRLPLPPLVKATIGTVVLRPPTAKPPAGGRPYFLMVGTIEPRKNHLLLLHVWRRLVETCLAEGAAPGQIPQLIIIGRRGWDCEQVLDLLERCPALYGNVLELPGCDDVSLSTWMHHAKALLYPSFVEGYGMPLIEALAHGVPVIASDLPVFREIAGEVPDYVDPLDGPGWARAIRDYAAPGNARRAGQLARMAGFKAPSWESHFDVVVPFVRALGQELLHGA